MCDASNIDHSGKDKLEVLLGAHNINQKESQQQRIQVQKYILHPCYERGERPNDIMLLKVLLSTFTMFASGHLVQTSSHLKHYLN